MTMAFLIIAIVAALGLSFFFSGSETAVISVNRYKLRGQYEQGDAEAGRIVKMLGNTQRLLIMVLIGTNLANVLAALLFKTLIQRGVLQADDFAIGFVKWSELLSLVLLTPILIIFAEILPKTLFRAHADALIRPLRPAYQVCLVLLAPFIWLVELAARWMLGPLTEARSRAVRRLTRQDVIKLINPDEEPNNAPTVGATAEEPEAAGQETPGIAAAGAALEESEPVRETTRNIEEGDERRMVENIITLHETSAEDIMTPLVDLVALPLTKLDFETLRSLAISSGYSRIPIYHDRIVHLIGFIDIFRVLREWEDGQKLTDYIERPHYVPERKRVDDLLQEFLELRIKNAIVVDEYGGCSGWISREDIIEEIVGELEDELDTPLAHINELGDREFMVDGRMEIDELNDKLGSNFGDDEWETLAGLILHEMGRIPKVGEEIVIEGWRMRIGAMDNQRIDKVRMSRDNGE